MAAVVPFIIAATSVASAGMSIASAVSQPSVPNTKVDTATQDKQSMQAAYAEADKLRKRQGASSTILTSPLGVSGQPQTTKATLGA